ncbi:hypothetical protein TNCV_2382191 [Trichonephila clavipes]|nr:hypothetical protein TNCV_2382191 [Trichonephila clavipes]
MTHPDIPIFYGYNASSRRGNVSPFARVRPQRWGKVMEGLMNDVFELVYQDSYNHSYLHYNGTYNNPNLTLATDSISEDANREVFY